MNFNRLVICAATSGVVTVAAAADIALESDGRAPEWVRLIPAGRFELRDKRGPFELADAEQVIARSREAVAAGEPPIDYDHQTDFAARDGVGGRAPAAGWVTRMEAREDGIWGKVAWTPDGRKAVEAREYRFLSPVFEADEDGRVVRVLRAALTNDPAITDMTAIASKEKEMDLLKQLRAALGLAEDASQETVLACVKARQTGAMQLATLAKDLGLIEEADPAKLEKPESVVEAAKADRQTVQAAAKVLQLGDDAGAEQVGQKVGELVKASQAKGDGNNGVPDPSQYVPRSEFDQVKQRLETIETASVEQGAQEKVDAAVKAGKITPAGRDWALQYAKQDPQGFDKFVETQPVICASDGQLVSGAKPAQTGKNGGLSEHELQLARNLGLSPDEFKKAAESGPGEEVSQ